MVGVGCKRSFRVCIVIEVWRLDVVRGGSCEFTCRNDAEVETLAKMLIQAHESLGSTLKKIRSRP